ncbi:MAG: hypothetical protein D6723_15185, partial [Acidobacteria bacterium]
LVEVTRRHEERLAGVEERLERAEERLAGVEEQIRQLVEVARRHEERLARLELISERLVDRVGLLYGRDLQRRYEQRPGAYMGRWLWPVSAVAPETLREALEARLSESEVEEVMRVDVLLRGQMRRRPDRPEVWVVMEVSAVIDRTDVERARRRAALLQQAGYRAIAAVAGERLTEGAEQRIGEAPIIVLLDGRAHGWERVLET